MQTTTRGRPDRTCGNTVLPKRRLADSPDEIPFPADMPSMHPRRPRGKAASPTESPVHPVPDSGLDTVLLGCEAKKKIHLRHNRVPCLAGFPVSEDRVHVKESDAGWYMS